MITFAREGIKAVDEMTRTIKGAFERARHAPMVEQAAPESLHSAPSFIQGHDTGQDRDHPYTAGTIADFIGWGDRAVNRNRNLMMPSLP